MLLSGDDLEIRMDINNKEILKDEFILELIGNIGVDTDQISEDTDFILIRDMGKDVVVINNLKESGEEQQTEWGEVIIESKEDEDGESAGYILYLDDEAIMDADPEDDFDIKIDVYRDMDMVDSAELEYKA